MERPIHSGSGVAPVCCKALHTVAPHNRPLRSRLEKQALHSVAPREAALRRQSGYTLIELMIVMAIISILLAIAIPFYQKSLTSTKESLLKNNLFTMRMVIDEYTFDKKKAPQTLQDLVNDGYLRSVPIDPITGTDQSWVVVMEDALTMVDQTQPGISYVYSGSDKRSLEGTLYSQW